jgi:integrase
VTTLQLEAWYSSAAWKKYGEAARSQRWTVVRSMFAFLLERKVTTHNVCAPIKPTPLSGSLVQGPFTDDQVEAVFTQARTIQIHDRNILKAERNVYRARLLAFMTLLLHTGCDLIDAALFQPGQIVDLDVDGNIVPVYRYNRIKTGVLAVIPLSAEVAQVLRSVPTLPSNPEGMPFRTKSPLAGDPKFWSRRIRKCLRAAGVTKVTLPRDNRGRVRTKTASAKQFRHTFAVRQLRAGQRAEEVATMLGHVDTAMVRKHYAPWVEDLDTAHVRRIVQRRAQ